MFSFRGESDSSAVEIPKFTLEQAIIISGYTHVMAMDEGSPLFDDVEKRLGRKITQDDYLNPQFGEEMRLLYMDDFMKLCFVTGKLDATNNYQTIINESDVSFNKYESKS